MLTSQIARRLIGQINQGRTYPHNTALRDIQDLLEKKVLLKEEAGGRSISYVLVL